MSMENVKKIVIRAVTEPQFRDLLFDDPDKALAEYELTEKEAANLKGMKRELFDVASSELEERMSRAGIGGLSLDTLGIGETADDTGLFWFFDEDNIEINLPRN